MQNRLLRKKRLANDRLRLFINMLLILVVALVNFEIIPNINTYINSSHLSSNSQPQIQASFTNEDLKKYRGNKTVIQIAPTDKKSWSQSDKRYLRLVITPADNARDFASSMDSSAKYVVQQLQNSKLSLKQVGITAKNTDNFDHYGYNMSQYIALLTQKYSSRDEMAYRSTAAIERILDFVSVLIIVVSLITLIWCIIVPKEKIECWI
ncbi:hypothetical protein [Lactobacillus amylolyticus]|uniref:hypothetical protein n=1 Tax=Lactobacillus amylolyticus TaxID=83683 RepID=UPI000FC9D6EE|nr:hypothetical protein [Lactobacillus amylolyticus]